MKETASLLMFLALVLIGCQMFIPGNNETSALPLKFTVEFVSEPLEQTTAFEPWGANKPRIAVGDITGDEQPEVALARGGWVPSSRGNDPEDLFYGHPVIFSWNGETFKQLEADWVGISSYSELRLVYQAQGLTKVLMITDVDHDGMNEIVIGSAPYRTAFQVRGAVYVFQWDGTRFVAEFSDYCMGAVERLDLMTPREDGAIAVSTTMRPVWDLGRDAGMCPEVTKGPDEPNTGLYALRAIGANDYETWPLTLDSDSFTALVAIPERLPGTQFVRLSLGKSTMLDWTTSRVIRYDGQVRASDLQIGIERPIMQMEAADLDGDGIDEIIVLAAAKSWDGGGLVEGDEVIWQVFQAIQDRYHLVYEEPAAFSSNLGYIFRFFAVGDVDNDGRTEVISSAGELYKWTNNQLVPQTNLIAAIGEDFYHGLESIYIGDVYGDGQNKVVFTARYFDSVEHRPALSPRMYVVRINYSVTGK